MVQNAQASKAPAQRIADTAGKYLVFVALGSGLLAFLIWYFLGGEGFLFALTAAVSTIVIACPDAFPLATPTAITVGVGKGAREGVLFKNATALEATAAVDTVIFDKTGTLTEGKPALTDVIVTNNFSETELLLLHESGVQTVMLTGDNKFTADAVARQLGMDTVIAEVLPEDKANEVKKLQAKDRKVAMVGDGVNDAPALRRQTLALLSERELMSPLKQQMLFLVKNDPSDVAGSIHLAQRCAPRSNRISSGRPSTTL